MLTKSKSKQVNLIKYALLIPMVFGMLLYTSSNAQEQTTKVVATQELSDEQLKEKLYKELIQLEESGADFFTISDAFMPKTDNYISTREEYYKFYVYTKRMFEKTKGTSLEYQGNMNELMSKMNRTYSEYLEFKKTDEAKERWENQTSKGFLKLVVNKLGSLTDEEKKKYDNKI